MINYQNSKGRTFVFIYDILGTVWRNNIKVSVTCYQQLTACYQQITNSWLTVGFLSADKLPTVCQLSQQTTNGQLTDGDRQPKGCFGNCSSQLLQLFLAEYPQRPFERSLQDPCGALILCSISTAILMTFPGPWIGPYVGF